MPPLDDLIADGVSGRRVLVRADLNVPLAEAADGSQSITDDGRIRASIPTLSALVEAGGRGILCAHPRPPKGAPGPPVSPAPVAAPPPEPPGPPVPLAT